MVSWIEMARGGVRLACRDFGGTGSPVLFLHGLAGHSGEWEQIAQALTPTHRGLALDQRGHGHSEQRPSDVSREAFVADVATVVGELGLGPVALVGQSMGANTALLVAAEHPDLVAALVVVEGSPDGPAPGDPPPDTTRIEQWLASWPASFGSETEARTFFSAQGLEPDAWTAGLRDSPDGLRPTFDARIMVECITALASRNYWPQWRSIRCPTLIVFGRRGTFGDEHGAKLVEQAMNAELVTVPDAGHDLHLDTPDQLSSLILGFLDGLEAPDRA